MTSLLNNVFPILLLSLNLHVTVAGPVVDPVQNPVTWMSCSVPLLQMFGSQRNCCPSTGRCQDSSCVVFGYANSEKSNCPGKSPDCPDITCQYLVPGCSGFGTGKDAQHCYGTVVCRNGPGTCQSESLGLTCLEDGTSENFKICGIGVDCVMNPWSTWSCGVSCGTGTATRSRTVKDLPTGGGALCPTKLEDSRPCNAGPCPIDCEMNIWSEWNCGVTCGEGEATRSRTVKTEASNGGAACPTKVEDSKPCYPQACPNGCVVSHWSDWTGCSKTCGEGTRSHERTVETQPTDGSNCPPLKEEDTCNDRPCPIDCQLTGWSDWTCGVTCGSGTAVRSRTIATWPINGGAACDSLNDEQPCSLDDCTPFNPEGDKCLCNDDYRSRECLEQENKYVGQWQVNFPNCDVKDLFESVSEYGCYFAQDEEPGCTAPTIYCREHIDDEVIAKLSNKCQKYIKPENILPPEIR